MNYRLIYFFRKLLITFIFPVIGNQVQSQSLSKIELQKIIEGTGSTKTKIDALNQLGDSLCTHKIENGRIYTNTALNLSKKEKYHKGIGNAYYNLGLLNFRRHNDSSVHYFLKAKAEFLEESPGFEKFAFTLNNISRAYTEDLKFDSAIKYGNLALQYSVSGSEKTSIKNKWIMFSNGAIANAYLGNSQLDSANIYLLNAIRLAEQLNNSKMLQVYYKGISSIQSQLGLTVQAIEISKKSLTYIEHDDRALTIALANLGSLYCKQNNYSAAKKMADSSLIVGLKSNTTNAIGRNYVTLGDCKFAAGAYQGALELYMKGLDEAEKNNNSKSTLTNIQIHIGKAFCKLENFKKAEEYFELALQTSKGDNEFLSIIYSEMSKLYVSIGDFKNGYYYQKLFHNFNDSVYTVEKNKIIAELNAKYNSEKKDQQVLLLTKENELRNVMLTKQLQQIEKTKLEKEQQILLVEKYQLETHQDEQLLKIQQLDLENGIIRQEEQRTQLSNIRNKLELEKQQKELSKNKMIYHKKLYNGLLLGLIGAFLILYLLFNRFKLVRKMEHQKSLIFQRQQISRDLHDEVGATLSGISMYSHLSKEQIKQNKIEEVQKSLNIMQSSATEMVNKLNDIVWLLNPEQDDLQKLLNRLEDFVRNMTAIKNIQATVTIPPAIASRQINIETKRNIYLFCKEAVINAVKYSEATALQFTVTEKADLLEIQISDNGIGFDKNSTAIGNGLGNLKKRADELAGAFSLISKPGEGCRIYLKVKIT